MSNLFATAGSRLSIGAEKAYGDTDFVASDFTTGSPTWTEIGGLTNLGSLGDASEVIKSSHLASRRVRKAKTTVDAGSMQVVADLDAADTGQLALIAAQGSLKTFAFKLTFNDAPTGGTPSIRYFTALVLNAVEQLDDASTQMKLNATLEIDGNIVRIAAAA